ncbi:Anthranilate synthase component 1 (plasmid) [Buchnera aphidicola (Anoecia corni)]|uniref:Anthranilate synthase component 1 n=1 Tax=Buchnera aphidicola (Anoecia corni) TaxID=2994477 RepID=A0AAT9J474_9GAMM
MNLMQVIKKKSNYYFNPTDIFSRLCNNIPATLLLESAEVKNKNKITSMIITNSALKISAFGRNVIIKILTINGQKFISKFICLLSKKIKVIYSINSITLKFPKIDKNFDEDKRIVALSIFDSLRTILNSFKSEKDFEKAMFLGGFFSYDLVSNFELLPKLKSTQNCPDFCFYLSEILVILDHQKKNCFIQASLFSQNIIEKNRILKKVEEIDQILKKMTPVQLNKKIGSTKIITNKNDKEYCEIIKKVQSYIRKGDIFQAVPSRKFFISCPYPLSAYHILKNTNPSPYMFYMQDYKFTLFGASPESSLKYNPKNRKIEIHPIAGTRLRGLKKDNKIDFDLDNRIELEMRTNKKELAEHIMLVDLARNDLAKICKTGTRYVSDLLRVDKYKHVMHLVSCVRGELKNHLDCLHAYQACMNMGTLTGSPKVKAMEIISKLEKEKRGTYGGAIGYLTSSGEMDTCIIIRSAYVENNLATVQTGAGVVLDSNPIDEAEESRNKAITVLKAIQASNLLLEEI